jgi:hypothetical protein
MNSHPIAANPARGEACIAGYVLRPTFTALVAAETELGPLFGLVERAAAGELSLAETAALLWHCVDGEVAREDFAEGLAEAGLVAVTPALKVVLGQILHGR